MSDKLRVGWENVKHEDRSKMLTRGKRTLLVPSIFSIYLRNAFAFSVENGRDVRERGIGKKRSEGR